MEQTRSDPSYDVPDSTDWLNTPLSGLMSVEQAFRCHVCKDFYNSPMITSCNHTFCSLCIRRCLSVDGKCPLCRKADQESRLRGNWALREAVECFKLSRASILEFARRPGSETVVASPKRRAVVVEDSDYEDGRSPKKPRRSTRTSRARGADATPAMSQEEDIQSPERNDRTDEHIPDDGLVACPICSQRMKIAAVDRHIGTGACPGAPLPQSQLHAPITNGASTNSRNANPNLPGPSKAKPQQPQLVKKAPEPLPPLNYSMLKDKALREKLHDLHLSSYGSRQVLEQRHKEWVTIWNANCDSAHPKTRAELLRDLDLWERTMNKTPSVYAAQTAQPQVKDKNFDGVSWATSHDDSFKDLIAKARQSKKQAEQKAKDSMAEDAARQPAEQGVQQPVRQPVEKSVQQPAQQPAQLPAQMPTRQPGPQPEQQPGYLPGRQQVQHPGLVTQQPNEGHLEGTDSGLAGGRGGGNQYHNAIYGFDGQAADFVQPIQSNGTTGPAYFRGPPSGDWEPKRPW